jgi:Chaperone of endosialidase
MKNLFFNLFICLTFSMFDSNSGAIFAQSSTDEKIIKPLISTNKNAKIAAPMSDWVLNGTEIYNLSTEVGLGTTTPGYKLDILHGGGTGLNVQSSASFSVLDIDAFSGDAAIRFAKNGVNQWNLRNNPANDNLQIFELGGGGERFQIQNTTGNLGLNDANPTEKLSIVGRIKMDDPSKGLGKVLTSDANGVGTWQTVGAAASGWTSTGSNLHNTSLGNVGIGTASPNGQLQLSNSLVNRKIVLYEAVNNDHQFYGMGIDGNTLRYQVYTPFASHVFYSAINGTSSKELLRITGNGNVTAAGVINFSSDIRLKKDIVAIENVIPKLALLRGYNYNWIDLTSSNKRQIGLLAQEVEKVYPELVETDDKGYKSVNYIGLIPVLLEGIKDLQVQLDAKNADINQLKSEFIEYKKLLLELKTSISK